MGIVRRYRPGVSSAASDMRERFQGRANGGGAHPRSCAAGRHRSKNAGSRSRRARPCSAPSSGPGDKTPASASVTAPGRASGCRTRANGTARSRAAG